MTQEHKDLLIKDLCARLPYGVKCENHNHVYGKNIFKVTDIRDNGYICGIINNRNYWAVFDPLELKPYLFPMSSITDEDYAIYSKIWEDTGKTAYLDGCHHLICNIKAYKAATDYLLSKQYDVNGLIPIGLANDATGLNIY